MIPRLPVYKIILRSRLQDACKCELVSSCTCTGIATEYYYKVTVYKHEEWPLEAVGKGYAKAESMASVAMRK